MGQEKIDMAKMDNSDDSGPNDALPYKNKLPVAQPVNPYIENKALIDDGGLNMTPQER